MSPQQRLTKHLQEAHSKRQKRKIIYHLQLSLPVSTINTTVNTINMTNLLQVHLHINLHQPAHILRRPAMFSLSLRDKIPQKVPFQSTRRSQDIQLHNLMVPKAQD